MYIAVSKGFLLVNEQGADMQGPDEVPTDSFLVATFYFWYSNVDNCLCEEKRKVRLTK